MSKSANRKRREEILAKWPVHAQLEALVEDREGRPEKLDALRTDVASIKEKHSKNVVAKVTKEPK